MGLWDDLESWDGGCGRKTHGGAGVYGYTWLIYFGLQQKPVQQPVKQIILQLKKKKRKN